METIVEKMTLTMKDGYDLIHEVFNTFMDSGDVSEVEATNVAYVLCNVQLRDYMLGMAHEKGIDYVGGFLERISYKAEKKHIPPVLSVLGCYYLEAGEEERSNVAISTALEMWPNYPFAKLVKGILDSNRSIRYKMAIWPNLREELHATVKNTIDKYGYEPLIESEV